MKNFLKNKGHKLCTLILVEIICLGIAGGCASGDDNINGYYRLDKAIYLGMPSSHAITLDDYIIADDSLTIVHADGTEEQITASFEKSEVDKEAFESLFESKIVVPDISVFKKRYQYSINWAYRLYMMDSELWLAWCPLNKMALIYRLFKIED